LAFSLSGKDYRTSEVTVKRESPDFIMDKRKKIMVWGFSKTMDLARFSYGPS